jgi:hypothetical protein
MAHQLLRSVHHLPMAHVLYVVGGPPRVGKSALGRRMLDRRGIPWLSTDILRTVLRTVVQEIDRVDRGNCDLHVLATTMYPHLERAANVALDQSQTFLMEGVEWLPRHVPALSLALENVAVRGCFLGHLTYSSDDLAAYQGLSRWHALVSEDEWRAMPGWIREWSERLRIECLDFGQPYVDVGEIGFHQAMEMAEGLLVG